MRQAGRYLPGYRALRAEHSFWDVCQNPELSTRAALEPLDRYALDAAIVFSDILWCRWRWAGCELRARRGTAIARSAAQRPADYGLLATRRRGERIDYLPRAVAHLKQTLDGRYGILGFRLARPSRCLPTASKAAGSEDFREARTLMHRDPALARRALNTIADVVAELCWPRWMPARTRCKLFDSWGGLLAPDEYRDFALPALQRITAKLDARKGADAAVRARRHHLLPLLGDSGVTGFSLDWRTEWEYARQMYPEHLLQGNIDPVLLLGERRRDPPAHARRCSRP
jgi:uroporphyrinogen decarboxylase